MTHKPGDLSSIPGTHVKGERSCSDLYTCFGTCAPALTHTVHVHTDKLIIMKMHVKCVVLCKICKGIRRLQYVDIHVWLAYCLHFTVNMVSFLLCDDYTCIQWSSFPIYSVGLVALRLLPWFQARFLVFT